MKKHTTKADETPEFVAFWQAWQPHMHKNDGRGLARDTFLEHVARGNDPQDIVDGARWYLRSRDAQQYIPHASTWLNRRAYEDFADKERQYQADLQERQSNVVKMTPGPTGQTAFLQAYQKKQGNAS